MNQLGVAWLVFAVALALLLVTAPDIGLTWDEPEYIAASESYVQWCGKALLHPGEALSAEAITRAWQVNKEHPPLDKIWTGLWSRAVRGFTDDLTANRVGNMVLVAALFALLFQLIRERYGRLAGLAAAVALLAMPRFFFHAHLAALDVAAATAVFVSTFVFWKTLSRSHWRWDVLLGCVWGAALATKINAAFVPVTLGLWVLLYRRQVWLFRRLLVTCAVGLGVFVLCWPWLYVETWDRLVHYLRFITVEHWTIPQYYLGELHLPPPWHFAPVMLWAVVPLGTTMLYLLGAWRSLRERQDGGLGALLVLSAATPVLALAVGKTMVYDNERLLMTAFPFLAGLAGIGFERASHGWRKLSSRWGPVAARGGGVALVALLVLPPMVSSLRLYPHLLSYYGAGVGGVAGANRLGLETTYWCESYAAALPVINEQAQAGDMIWSDPTSHDVLGYYQRIGRLRADLGVMVLRYPHSFFGPEPTPSVPLPDGRGDWFIQQHRQTTFCTAGPENRVAAELQSWRVVHEVRVDDVPILTLRKR